MTNLEALQSIIGNYQFPDNTYIKALIDVSVMPNCLTLDPAQPYVAANIMTVDIAVAGLIKIVIINPDIKEGGYELSTADRAILMELRKDLLLKYGLTDELGYSTIKNASFLW